MTMSAGVEWGVHVCLLLAQANGGLVRRRAIADHFGLPEAYLAKQLTKLVAAGVLDAVPGPAGGYRLASDPKRITLLNIVEAIEGTRSSFVCTEIRRQGTGAADPSECVADCTVKSAMLAADNAWRQALRAQTVNDLSSRLSDSVRRRYASTARR
ncbi:Rrf2 family transcriptional regulator [Cutibacterium sp. WCA-380-WT-3A]|uniref:Rrf2 family transcriptional regulator n=1 Tax=Cutibacterium porci TaxID=2605781 RepID=A0A7K0J5F8_9ACTN|nr:Rrf2 family transcriptional regulator [Cutibacterium porci]MSS45176.1 Rrf2 family transcriptional regulator [Cutibacterium porci]